MISSRGRAPLIVVIGAYRAGHEGFVLRGPAPGYCELSAAGDF